MKRKYLLCFAIILTAMFYLTGAPAIAAPTAKNPAAKAVVIPVLQTQYANVLIQLEIMPKAAKSTPKLSDKIKYEDFTLYSNNAMSVETQKVTTKAAKNAKVKYITLAEAEGLLLKALGYENKIEKNSKIIHEKAVELGLTADLTTTPDKQITRGEAAVLIFNSLTIPFADAEKAVNSYRHS